MLDLQSQISRFPVQSDSETTFVAEMHSFLCSLAGLVLLSSTGAASWPTSGNAAASSEPDLKLALVARQDVAGTVLIGDLRNGATTPVGFSIANILSGSEEAQTTAGGYAPPKLGTDSCATDECKTSYQSRMRNTSC